MKICNCTDTFMNTTSDCKASPTYGPQRDNLRSNLEKTYSLKCGGCPSDDYVCQCTLAYTQASSKYSQCLLNKQADPQGSCDCRKTFLNEASVCNSTSLGDQLRTVQKTYDTYCSNVSSNNSTNTSANTTNDTSSISNATLPDCTRLYTIKSLEYQNCTSRTGIEMGGAGIGNNPHPNCQCVQDFVNGTRSCSNDPLLGPSINALVWGANRAPWMASCRQASCAAFPCPFGFRLRQTLTPSTAALVLAIQYKINRLAARTETQKLLAAL